MFRRELLSIFLIGLVMIAGTHCAIDHGRTLRKLLTLADCGSTPLQQNHPCHESGCLCKGAIVGQEITYSPDTNELAGGLHVPSPSQAALIETRRLTSSSWLANLLPHGANHVRAHLQSFLL
jgi:hypothetical protein